MKPTSFEFSFDGPAAAADAQALADWLAKELPEWRAQPAARPVSQPVPGTKNAELTVAIVALIVALPSGINDGLDLVERIKLKAKIERLIAWARERATRQERNPFVALPNGAAVPLEQARTDQLLDAVAAGAPKRPPKS